MLLSNFRLVVFVRSFVAIMGLLNAYLTIRLLRSPALPNSQYSYIDNDFPADLEVPDIHASVALVTESTVHYQLFGSVADDEWSKLMPKPAALVRLGPHYRPFAVAMLHSLHCLDKLRRNIRETPSTRIGRIHVEHCANYIRESILCGADITLEPTADNTPSMDSLQPVIRECQDWAAVYREVQRNHEEYVKASVEVPYA